MKKLVLGMSVLIALASCGGNQEAATPAAEPAATQEVISDTALLSLEGNDLMKYDKTELEAYEGQVIQLTFKNAGTLPKEAMGHNVTVLVAGANVEAYGTAAMTAKDTEYQPVAMADQVIAKTKVLGPGEEEVLVFAAPAAGEYTYVCTFPGHYASMQGKLVVKARPQ